MVTLVLKILVIAILDVLTKKLSVTIIVHVQLTLVMKEKDVFSLVLIVMMRTTVLSSLAALYMVVNTIIKSVMIIVYVLLTPVYLKEDARSLKFLVMTLMLVPLTLVLRH